MVSVARKHLAKLLGKFTRLIIQEYIDRLLNLPKVAQINVTSLTALTSILYEFVEALKVLGVPVASWTYFNITLVSNSLDSTIREA